MGADHMLVKLDVSKADSFRDAIVQEDLMKAVRKLNDAKKHEGTM